LRSGHHERLKKSPLNVIRWIHFGMPLHSQAPRVVLLFNRLDQSIIRPAHCTQACTKAINPLMMPRKDLQFGPPEDLAETTSRLQPDEVATRLARGQAMRHGVTQEVW
jgi:hypothetical protein